MMKNLYTIWLRLSMVVGVLALSTMLYAQRQSVSGKVIDETGQPIPGISVLEKGTSNGTATDSDGRYTLNVAGPDAVLVLSFIGYTTQEVTVGSRTALDDITMTPDVTSLEEVIVTGYLSERKQDIVAAVSTISTKNTIAVPVPNIEQAIQGRVAGVQVITSGQPGAASQVRIRGFGSFTNNLPLYIVDGVPTFNVDNLDPNDIETTTILKDAAAATIYGARAASGVIVYTTKQSKYDGSTNVSYNMSVGFNAPGEGIEILNPQQTAEKTWEAFRNVGQTPTHPQYGKGNTPVLPDYINVGGKGGIFEGDATIDPGKYNIDFDKGAIYQIVRANKAGTDWYGEMTRNAPVTRHSLGLSGGNNKSRYYVGLGYYNQQGIAINQYLKRYSARINSEFKPIERIRIGENFQVTYRDNPQIGDPQSENQLNHAYRMNPIIPVHDEFGGYAGTAAPGLNNPNNPVASLERLSKDYNQQTITSLFGNLYAEVDVLKDLTFRTSFGGAMFEGYNMTFNFRTYENSENNGAFSINEAAAYGANWVWTNTATYKLAFDDHAFKALVGYEAIKDPARGRFIAGVGLNPFSIDPNYIGIGNSSSTGRQVNSGPNNTPRTLASFFGRIDYNFKERYYLSATLRRDGSSAFGSEKRYGNFPAITAGWRITSESFMDGTSSWLDDLKIRAGWGIMGNQNINPTNQYTLYGGNPATGYDIGGSNNSISPGIIPQQIGNPAGAWERNITTNIGLDAFLFDGKVDIILDVWKKKTEDLLYDPQFAATGGVYPTYPFINVGSIDNRGIDLQIIARHRVNSDFDFIVDANIGTIKNEIKTIAEGLDFFDNGTFRNLTFVRNAVGESLSSFFGYKMIGYFADAEDVENSPKQAFAAPGRFKFQDINGDNVVDAADRAFIGSPIPKFTYGLNLTANYKNFTLEAFFYGKYGNDIVNFSKWFTDFYPSFSGAAIGARTLNSWTPENQNAETPIFENASNFSTNTQANSWYVEKGSYLRMKNLQLYYNIPASILDRINIKTLRVYLQAVNLFTITKYKGKDPEIASSVDTTLGVDVGNYPATRIYSIGLNLGL